MANSKHERVNDVDTVATVEDAHSEDRAQGLRRSALAAVEPACGMRERVRRGRN